MPYELVKYKRGWRVKNTDSNRYYSKKPMTKAHAIKQQRLLYALEKNPDFVQGSGYCEIKNAIRCDDVPDVLDGSGLFNNIVASAKQYFSKAAKSVFTKTAELTSRGVRLNYPPSARAYLAKNGAGVIQNITIQRTPIQSVIDKALNFLTLGKFQEAKQKYSYDNLFHLSMACVYMIDGRIERVFIEKNEVIRISESYNIKKDTQIMPVPYEPGTLTLGAMMSKAAEKAGPSFYTYDAFTNNCQVFINTILDANNLNTSEVRAFVMQDAPAILRELPEYAGALTKTITNLGALKDVVVSGQGEGKVVGDTIVMKKSDFVEEHKHLLKLLKRHPDLMPEYKKQKAEMKQYVGSGGSDTESELSEDEMGELETEELSPQEKDASQKVGMALRALMAGDVDIEEAIEFIRDQEYDDNVEKVALVLLNTMWRRYALDPEDDGEETESEDEGTEIKGGIEKHTELAKYLMIKRFLDTNLPEVERQAAEMQQYGSRRAAADAARLVQTLRHRKAYAEGKVERRWQGYGKNDEQKSYKVKPTVYWKDEVMEQLAKTRENIRQLDAQIQMYQQRMEQIRDKVARQIATYQQMYDESKDERMREHYAHQADILTDAAEMEVRDILAGLMQPLANDRNMLVRRYNAIVTELNAEPDTEREDSADELEGDGYHGGAIDKDTYLKRQSRGIYPQAQTYEQYVAKEAEQRKRIDAEIGDLKTKQEEYQNYIIAHPDEEDVVCKIGADLEPAKGREVVSRAECNARHVARNKKIDEATPMGQVMKGLISVGDTFTKIIPMPGIAKAGYQFAKSLTGNGKSEFQTQLDELNITPKAYLESVRASAKKAGYNPEDVMLSDDDSKIAVRGPDGKLHRAGRTGYGDFHIYSILEKRGAAPMGTAASHRKAYLARATKIKGDWKKDKYSPNTLAIRILWDGPGMA